MRWIYVCIAFIFAKTEKWQGQFGAVQLRQMTIFIFFPFKEHG